MRARGHRHRRRTAAVLQPAQAEEYRLPERVKAQHILFKTRARLPKKSKKIREKARGSGSRQEGRGLRRPRQSSSPKTLQLRTAETSGLSAAARWFRSSNSAAFQPRSGRHQRSRSNAVRHSHHQGERKEAPRAALRRNEGSHPPIVLQRQAEENAAAQIQKSLSSWRAITISMPSPRSMAQR